VRISVPAEATALEPRDGYHVLEFDDGTTASARTVLIATGAHYRKLTVPRIEEFEGTCVFYAATLMEAQLCRNALVAVVGGGNSAAQAALFLAEHTQKVRLLIRHGDLGRDMSRYLADRIERNPGVAVLPHTEVRELVGDKALEALIVEDNLSGERRRLEARDLFVFIAPSPVRAGSKASSPSMIVVLSLPGTTPSAPRGRARHSNSGTSRTCSRPAGSACLQQET